MSIPAQYEQFVGSPYPRVYIGAAEGGEAGGAVPQFDEYADDCQTCSKGPFVLKTAYDALYELLREQKESGIQTALEDGTPFTFIGTEPTLREKINAACAEAAEHGENFSFSGNVVRETGERSTRTPAAVMVIPHDDPSMLGKLNHARHTGQRVAIEISPEIDAELQKVRVLTGSEPRPDPTGPTTTRTPLSVTPSRRLSLRRSRSTSGSSAARYRGTLSQDPEDTIRRMFGDTPGADL